jgi:alkyldihydroxyacetonephosphate synthase
VNHICIGSEGILGVITEATMQVHPLPERRAFYGYIFPDFESGIAAIQNCVEENCAPVITRLNDAGKTALSFAYKSNSSGLKNKLSDILKVYLKSVKRYDLSKICLMLTAFEGSTDDFKRQRKKVNSIYRRFGAVNLGTEPGKTFERGKYDFPYLRDYVMDRNIMADVSETATVWSNILPLYYKAYTAIDKAVRNTGYNPFLGCHISHTYHTGASLYFTFGCLQKPGMALEQYLYIKKAAEDAFLANGGSLSHHHAVGTEHLPWIEKDISSSGLKAVQALKNGLDPSYVMNPGKIVADDYSLEKWGLPASTANSLDSNGKIKRDSSVSPAMEKEAHGG